MLLVNEFLKSVKVGWFLATRRLRRSGALTTLMIIFVMALTFLNLVFVRGILIGLPAGAIKANEDRYYSDIYISAPENKKHITNGPEIIEIVKNEPAIAHYTQRYIITGSVTNDSDARLRNDEKQNTVRGRVIGLDAASEEPIINFSNYIIAGPGFSATDKKQVLLGKELVTNFDAVQSEDDRLEDVDIGSEVDLIVGETIEEVTIVGFISSKLTELDAAIIIKDEFFEDIVGRDEFKPDEIIVKLEDGYVPVEVKEALIQKEVQKFATVQTKEEYQPSFVEDIVATFGLLGDVIGSISLAVAAITIFIIIFVNAITQKKFIGILKGIGISALSIEISYMIQGLFYVLIGASLGIFLLYGFLVPYFDANPIDFPFADGVLIAEYNTTFVRTVVLLIATTIAGLIPARYIVQKNTLDAILGR